MAVVKRTVVKRAVLKRAVPRSEDRGWGGLRDGAVVLVDTAPWIYLLQDHPDFAPRFVGLFAAAEQGAVELALSTITLAEILTGPHKAGQVALAKRYEKALACYQVVPLSVAVASEAARLRARYGLKPPDAAQLASALEIGAAALVTHDRDFSAVQGLSILYGE
jgi:predicted nucleic acid-binding protein